MINIDELYMSKGKITTQLEILQNSLNQVNMQIADVLKNQSVEGQTNGNKNKIQEKESAKDKK